MSPLAPLAVFGVLAVAVMFAFILDAVKEVTFARLKIQ